MDNQRKIIESNEEQVHIIGYTLGDIAETINDLLERYGPNAKLVYENHPDRDIYVEITRPETDSEMNVRISIERTMQLQREARDMEHYQQLHKRYGGNNG